MSGTRAGGLKAVATVKANDPDFYKNIGTKGGNTPKSKPWGFSVMSREKVQEAGRKGGIASKRHPKERHAQAQETDA
jgi:general stress protein YciG